jgi:hypothetical protein
MDGQDTSHQEKISFTLNRGSWDTPEFFSIKTNKSGF